MRHRKIFLPLFTPLPASAAMDEKAGERMKVLGQRQSKYAIGNIKIQQAREGTEKY